METLITALELIKKTNVKSVGLFVSITECDFLFYIHFLTDLMGQLYVNFILNFFTFTIDLSLAISILYVIGLCYPLFFLMKFSKSSFSSVYFTFFPLDLRIKLLSQTFTQRLRQDEWILDLSETIVIFTSRSLISSL